MFVNHVFGLLVLLSLVGCGVATDSSHGYNAPYSGQNDDNSSTGSSDDNSTTDSTDGNSTSDDEDYIFDSTDAEKDLSACSSANATANPLQNNAGDERETADSVNGMKILSLYNETTNDEDSNVVLYYNVLSSDASLEDSRSNVYGDNSRFIVTYNLVWVTQSDNTVYVKIPKLTNELPSCFRIKLDSTDGNSITPVKVYR